MNKKDLSFFSGKRVLVTGHTGFKGSWLCQILIGAGAEVTGYSLEPPTTPSLFNEAGIADRINHIVGDIRDREKLMRVFKEVQPEIVLHLAAQPIVRESYKDPVGTYETNVMGTVNICEAVRQTPSVKSFLNVTTDKVYKNNEWCWGYRENEPLDGYDPYSNSKSCSELVTHSYINSFYCDMDVAVSTARAGNVIGGGDYAPDRIIPDCVRAAEKNEVIIVRNPYSTRPYQHVLEPLNIYLTIAKGQYEDKTKAGFYNVGPDDYDCVTTGDIVDKFCDSWNNYGTDSDNPTDASKKITWINKHDGGPHEANFLKLDCSLVKNVFGWNPVWNIDKAVEMVVQFSKRRLAEPDKVAEEMDAEIAEFFK
ncbi:MAG: CDP-glucose 4,6-dehydratase [Eubacterium sp.]|nr:CDP-glucose 4,6-dehydratase [Eubacterium sp.]